MSLTSLWPGGIFLTFGLWFDRRPELPALAALGDVLEDRGGTYSGAMFHGPPGVSFSRVPDAPGIAYTGVATTREVRRRMRDGSAYRVAMNLPEVGPVAVSYASTPGESPPAERHPVEVTMEAGAFSVPRELWDSAERFAAEARQPLVLKYLEACCVALDPAYAVLHAEESTPTPPALAAGQPVGLDVYLSRRLAAVTDLSHVGRLSQTRVWRTGLFHSGWFLGPSPNPVALRTAWADQSRRLSDDSTPGRLPRRRRESRRGTA